MSFQLRREEVLDGEQLRAMLEESPARAAQAILLAAGEGIVDAQALARADSAGRPWHCAGSAAGAALVRASPPRQGHLMARNMLGRCHEHGWGCGADAAVAAQALPNGGRCGTGLGDVQLANLLATGRGVPRISRQALNLYRRAAELGHAKSMNLLGRYLEEGRVCPADPLAARDWYRRSGTGRGFSWAVQLCRGVGG